MLGLSVEGRFARFSLALVLLGLFFNPISIALSNLLLLGALLSLIVGSWSWRLQMVARHRWLWALVALMILMTVMLWLGVLPPKAQYPVWGTKLYLLLTLLAIMPFFKSEVARERAYSAFINGIFVVCILLWLYSLFFHLVDSTDIYYNYHGQSFRLYHWTSYLPLSTLSALAMFMILHRFFMPHSNASMNFVQLVVIGYVNLFLFSKRTGVIVMLCLLLLFCWQRFRRKGLVFAIIVILAAISAMWQSSSQLRDKFTASAHDVVQYWHAQNGELSPEQTLAAYQTSVGQRLYLVHLAEEIVSQKPWLGYGSGTVAVAYNQLNDAIFAKFDRKNMHDPDNTYVQIAIQWGLLGLVIYLLFWLAVIVEARHLPLCEKYLARGVAVAYLVAGLSASVYWKHATVLALYTLLAVVFSASKRVQSGEA